MRDRFYEVHYGVVVDYYSKANIPSAAFVVLPVGSSPYLDIALGFKLNTNRNAPIKVDKEIEKSVSELASGYSCRNHDEQFYQDGFDHLNWVGYAYIRKELTLFSQVKTFPLLLISNPVHVDKNIWEEISTSRLIKEINKLAKINEVAE